MADAAHWFAYMVMVLQYCAMSLRLSYQLRNSAHPGRKAICICVFGSVFSGLVV